MEGLSKIHPFNNVRQPFVRRNRPIIRKKTLAAEFEEVLMINRKGLVHHFEQVLS